MVEVTPQTMQQPAELAGQAQNEPVTNQVQVSNQVEPQTAPAPVTKPISQIDKLKLMIIRIGDE